MPIWIKIVLFFWAITPVGVFFLRMWARNHPLEVYIETYPKWIVMMGVLIIVDIVSIIPVAFWFIFFK